MALTAADFEVQDLTELDSDDVNQVLDRLAGQLQEMNPAIDLKRGVFKDTVAYFHAVLETAIRTNLERYQSARSLQQIQADPSLADDGIVNEVLSNWGITRRIGTKAVGSVTIELDSARTITVPAGFLFEADGKRYETVVSFVSRTNIGQVATVNDRLLIQLNNGNWAFTVEVEAAEVGLEYKLNAGDLIIPNRSLVSYVTSYATSTFSDGTNTETNADLIDELQLGISAKTLSNRTNMRSWLRSIPSYGSVTNQSIVGYGDPEMLRDKSTIFPISFGGRVDWYIRGQAPLQRSTFEVTATLLSISRSKSIWQFPVRNTVFPGFYEVSKIRRLADSSLNSGFEILWDSRVNDLTGDGFIPDIRTVADGAYTAFQTATIQFEDTATDAGTMSVGDTSQYVCEITGVPLIAELQIEVSSRDVRSYAADALIKAPVPCFVDITFTINKAAGDPVPNIDAIKSAVVEGVNQTGFIGRLDGSLLLDIIHNYITDDISVTDLDLFGRVRRPDGTVQYIRDSDSLVIEDQPERMVTAKTVQFFAEVPNVSINVRSVIPTAN